MVGPHTSANTTASPLPPPPPKQWAFRADLKKLGLVVQGKHASLLYPLTAFSFPSRLWVWDKIYRISAIMSMFLLKEEYYCVISNTLSFEPLITFMLRHSSTQPFTIASEDTYRHRFLTILSTSHPFDSLASNPCPTSPLYLCSNQIRASLPKPPCELEESSIWLSSP